MEVIYEMGIGVHTYGNLGCLTEGLKILSTTKTLSRHRESHRERCVWNGLLGNLGKETSNNNRIKEYLRVREEDFQVHIGVNVGCSDICG